LHQPGASVVASTKTRQAMNHLETKHAGQGALAAFPFQLFRLTRL
jgi:hypothetical protein